MRDEKGRFLPGGSGNPKGRKPRATEQEYQDAVADVIPIERWCRILEAQARRAEKGDVRSFEALARYLAPVTERQQTEHSGGVEITVRYVD